MNSESKSFKLSKTKIEYLECKFNNATHKVDEEVSLFIQVILKRGRFKYILDRSSEVMERLTMMSHIGLE